MKTSKRLLSLFLAVVMVITSCSIGLTAFAADPPEDSVFTYIDDEGKAVEITYESLEELVNTYAPTIIAALRSVLEGIGVDVDVVCSADEPIHELLGQLAPTLMGLLGGSGSIEEGLGYYEQHLKEEGKSYASYNSMVSSLKSMYFSYLEDDNAAMEFWALYTFCNSNLENDNDMVSDFSKQVVEIIEPMIDKYPSARDSLNSSVTSSVKVIEQLLGSTLQNGIVIYNVQSEGYDEASRFTQTIPSLTLQASETSVSKVTCSGNVTFKDESGKSYNSNGLAIGEIPNVIITEGSSGEVKTDFTPFIEYVTAFARFANCIGDTETLTLAQAIQYYYNQKITSVTTSAALLTALAVSRGNTYTANTALGTITVKPGESLRQATLNTISLEYFSQMLSGMGYNIPVGDALEALYWSYMGMADLNPTYNLKSVFEPYYKDSAATLLVQAGVYDSYDAVDQAASLTMTESDFMALKDRLLAIQQAKTNEKETNKTPTYDEFRNGYTPKSGSQLNTVDTIFTESSISPVYQFYINTSGNYSGFQTYLASNYNTFRQDLMSWNGGEFTESMKSFAAEAEQFFYAYSIWDSFFGKASNWNFTLVNDSGTRYIDEIIIYNGVIAPSIGNPYNWEQIATDYSDLFNSDVFVEIVNSLLNNLINQYLDPETQIGGMISGVLDALLETSVDVPTALKDIYLRLAEKPVETVFDLLPIIVVAADELLIPLFFNAAGDTELGIPDDAYYNASGTLVDNLLANFIGQYKQSSGSPIGLSSLRWDLNDVIPTLIHWLNGDNDYTYTYYNAVETVDEETGDVISVQYGTPTTGANGTKYDDNNQRTYNVPVILNIYVVDKFIAGASISDIESPEARELVSNLALIAQDVIDNYVAEHRNDYKGVTSMRGTTVPINRGLNNIFVSLPTIINDIGKKFLSMYNVDSDWYFGTFDTDENGYTYNVALKNFKQLAADSAPADEILGTFVDIFINNWFNAVTDLLNSIVADPNNDITSNLPIVTSLLDVLDVFGEKSVLTDILNGFFMVTRDHADSFTFEEQENGYVGLSTLSAYFLLSNLQPIIEIVMNIVDASKSEDGDAGSDTTTDNSPVVDDGSSSSSSIKLGIDVNEVVNNLDELITDENTKVANELIESVDSLISTLLSNTLVNGFTVDEVDGILSGAITFLTNYLGTDTTNELLSLVTEYLKVINAANTTSDGSKNASSDGNVDADKVYTDENLSNLVTQTYALLEKIIDELVNINGDDNQIINGAIKGIISPGAVAVRSETADGEYAMDQDLLSELSWTDVAESKYAKDLGYSFKAGDKEGFYENLISSLGVIPAVAGALLCTTGYYNDVVMKVLGPICEQTGADYIATIASDATGNEAVYGMVYNISSILGKFLEAPSATLIGLIKGFSIIISDDSLSTIINNALNPIYDEISGLSVIVGKLSPLLATKVSGLTDTIKNKVGEYIPQTNIFVGLIEKVTGVNLAKEEFGKIIAQLATVDNGAILLAIYTVAIDLLTNNETLTTILSLISGADVNSLVNMLGKLDAVKVFYMLKEIINSTQDPTEIYWTFSKYAAKETNTFSYPKGITAEEADDAVDSLDDLVKNLFPLLQSFDVVDQGSLPELVSGLLFTNETVTKIATGVYGAIEDAADGSFVFSPKQLAAYLTDSSYGTTFSSAANTLSKCSSWDNVKNVNWGFTDGSSKAQQGFVNALAALCRPVNDVLAAFLAGGEVNIAELAIGILKDLNISTDSFKLVVKNYKATITIYSDAKGSKPNTIEINLAPVVKELSALAITGGNGYQSAIIPLLEALKCDGVKTYNQYLNDYNKAKDNLLINILNPIMGFVNDVLEAPFDTISAVLPNVAYFIDNNGIGQLLNNLLSPLTEIIGILDDNGINVDKLIKDISGKSLAGLVEGLINDGLNANIKGLNLQLTDLNSCNIQEFLIPIVNALLKNNNINIKLDDIDWGLLASLGTLNNVSSAAGGTTKQITANQGQVLVTVLRYIEGVLINNSASIYKLLSGIDKLASNKTVLNILESVFARIATANDDDIVLAVFYLLCGDPTNTFFDYRGFQYKDYEFSYPSTVDIDFLKNIAPMLDGLVGGLVSGGLNATVANLIYKDDIITSLATGLYGAVEGVKVGSMSLTTLLAKTGIDFTTTNVANLLVDKDYGQTYESAAKVIRSAGSWSKVDASKLSWGVTDRDSFVHALCAVLRPIYGVLDVLLNDASLGLFNLIYLPGSDGYTSAIVPLMEAFGLYNIKTQYQYRQDMSKEYDAILLDIINPLLDKVEDILNAPIQTIADMLPNLALFFANDGLLQLIENLLTPINALLDAVSPVADVNDILSAVGLDIGKELSKLGLVGSGYKFDIYDLAGSLKPLIGADNIVALLNKVLGLIKIGGTPLGIELMPIDWYQLASHGEVITNEASQASTFGGRIYVKSDPNEVLIAVLRYLIETINYKDNYSIISSLIGGLIGGAGDSISGVVDQVLGMLTGDTDEVISELCGLLQTLA